MKKNLSHALIPFTVAQLVLMSFLTAGCGSMSRNDSALTFGTALSNINPAPESMTPPEFENENGPVVDSVYMRAQADYHFTMAEAYSMEGQSDRAIEAFKLTLVYDPKSAMVRMRLAAEYIRQGLLSEAIEQTEAAVEAEPSNIDAKMLLGGLYSSLKMYDLALVQYRTIVSQDTTNVDAPIFIGAILAEKGQYSDAIAYFQALAQNKKYKEPHKAHYYIGRIHLERGEAQAVKDAQAAYLRSIQAAPSYVEATLALATLYESQNQKSNAVRLLSSFQEKFGPDRDVAKQLSRLYLEDQEYDKAFLQLEVVEGFERSNLNVKLQMALIMIEQKRYQEAAVRLEDILLEAPESDKIRYYLGAVYEELGEGEEAVKHFQRVPASSEYFAEAVILAANIKKKKGENKKAVEIVKEAIGFRDDIPQFYAFYAALLDELKEYNQAIKMLNDAVAKFPSHTQLRFFLGSMHDRVGDRDKTIENMKLVLEIDDNHVQAMNYLAYTYAEANINLEDAEKLARRALAAKPQDGYILDTVGWIMFKKGDLEAAVKYLEAAFKANSDESVIAEHLADVYTQKELLDKAVQLYRKAIELESDAKKLQELEQKITAIQNQDINKSRLPASSEKPKPIR